LFLLFAFSFIRYSFLSSRIACLGESLGDFIADAEEYLVGSLPLECRELIDALHRGEHDLGPLRILKR
jgi:hypothetical protein